MPIDPPKTTKPPLSGVVQWNTKQKVVTPLHPHPDTTAVPMSNDIYFVAQKFKDQCKRLGHLQSIRLKNAMKALDDFLVWYAKKDTSQAPDTKAHNSLYYLRASVVDWKSKDPKEFEHCGGPGLSAAIDALVRDAETAKSQAQEELLQDGDILFRYVPRGMNQRGPIQGLITAGQGLQQLTQALWREPGASVGTSWHLVQHVGIYLKGENAFNGVIEIDGNGLSRNNVANRVHEYDLVVRCKDKGMAKKITQAAVKVKPMLSGGQNSKTKTIWRYPLIDLFNLATHPHTGGALDGGQFDNRTYETLVKLSREYFVKNQDYDEMAQMVVCSHFVHAVLWNALWPYLVSIRAATDKRLDKVFKISPSHLWRQVRQDTKQGVWAKIDAEFVGLQQDGHLFCVPKAETKAYLESLAA